MGDTDASEQKQNLLGEIKYHLNHVQLLSSLDELKYQVSTITRTLNGDIVESSTETFTSLSVARQVFEDRVYKVIGLTSLTDVSLFMQQSPSW